MWVRGRPAKQDGEALGLAEVPGAGSGSTRRLPALRGVEGRRLAPLPARPAASHRAPGSAPRPGRRSAGDPSTHCGSVSRTPLQFFLGRSRGGGNSASPSRRQRFCERQRNGSTYGGPGAAGKFGGGLGSTAKIPCSALPPRGHFVFPACRSPTGAQHKPSSTRCVLQRRQVVCCCQGQRQKRRSGPV